MDAVRILRGTHHDAESDGEWGDLWMESRRYPKLSYTLSWVRAPGAYPFSQSRYDIESGYVIDAANREAWLQFCWPLLAVHDAWFATICLNEEWLNHNFLTLRKRRLPDFPDGYRADQAVGTELHNGIPGVYWGTYFGPFYVDWFGRSKFDALPYLEKRELPTGGIFFTSAPTPYDWQTPETQRRQQAIKEHLGADAFFDIRPIRAKIAAMGGTFQRSSMRVRRWPPVAPQYSLGQGSHGIYPPERS